MQASNGETKELGVTAGDRRPSWEKITGKSETRCHEPARGGYCIWKVTCVEECGGLVFVGVSACV